MIETLPSTDNCPPASCIPFCCDIPSTVFAYGSVPLKTYLPDGDIDLTVLGNASRDSTLVNDVYCILDSEEQNSDAEFEVKNSDQINAKVRLIKCTIENIIVDISFNQTGGICALCFLELVLYRFLEYFSKFDWDRYCISLNGPVALSSLPNLIVEATGTHTDDLLFDKEFLRSSVAEVFVPPKDSGQSGTWYTRFRPKHLNIIDPLTECNNLGRSVNRASFHRVRTALSYGAQKLGQILILQSELIPNEIYGFFKNTLGRNGRGSRPDVASTGALHPSFGTVLEERSIMSISYRKGDENGTPYDLSKCLGENGLYVTNAPSHFSNCLPGGHKTASSTDLRSSRFVHHGLKQHSLFYQENGNEKCDMDCYVDHEMEQLSYCPAKIFDLDDRSSIQSQVHVSNQLPTLNSYANVNHLATSRKSWSAVHVKKQQVHPLSLRLSDLSGDLDLQFRCLHQVQYHLEYLFDGVLQSVQEAFFQWQVSERPFNIPTLSILLNADAGSPSVESNGRKLSTDSCSDSSEAVSQHSQDEDLDPWDMACQQNISLPSGTDIPSNGLSPSSSYADSDSSVSGCCSSEDSLKMHGTDASVSRKSYDTYKEQVLAASIENGKIQANRSVLIETNPSAAPGGRFVHNQEQVALPGRIKEMTMGQLMYIHSDRKDVENHSRDRQKEFIRHDNKTRQIPKYHGDTCLNTNILQNQQYGTDMEFARTPSAMRQMPKYQPFNRIQIASKDCTSASLSRNLPRKQSYGTRKEDEILDWQTRHIPSYEPLNLNNQQCGWVCSKKYSAGKPSYNNHKDHLSFVRGTERIPCNGAASILSGIEREDKSNKFHENGNHLWPSLQEAPLSLRSNDNQDSPPVSDTSLPSFPITNGPPLESIEFGSLGPFALALSKSKSMKVTITHPGFKVSTDASASVLQRSRAGSRHSRSPDFCKVANEDEFPPLNAGVR